MRRTFAAMCWLFLFSSLTQAQPAAECFPNLIRFDVCEKAREAQEATATTLPMQISANVTLTTIIAVGPRVILTAVMKQSKADLDAMIRTAGISCSEWTNKVETATKNSVCTAGLAPFVRLGGQAQYIYKSQDGFTLFSPLVVACP